MPPTQPQRRGDTTQVPKPTRERLQSSRTSPPAPSQAPGAQAPHEALSTLLNHLPETSRQPKSHVPGQEKPRGCPRPTHPGGKGLPSAPGRHLPFLPTERGGDGNKGAQPHPPVPAGTAPLRPRPGPGGSRLPLLKEQGRDSRAPRNPEEGPGGRSEVPTRSSLSPGG